MLASGGMNDPRRCGGAHGSIVACNIKVPAEFQSAPVQALEIHYVGVQLIGFHSLLEVAS
jgi:hypothetical protein